MVSHVVSSIMILQIDSYPEARRRCTGRPVKATLRWSSCCWSRAPPWRKRTNSAGAPGLNGFARMGWVEIRFHLCIAELQNKKSETRSRCLFFLGFPPLVCIWHFVAGFVYHAQNPKRPQRLAHLLDNAQFISSEIWLRSGLHINVPGFHTVSRLCEKQMSLHAEPNPCQVWWVKLNTSLERTSIASRQLWWCVWAEPLVR